MIPDGQIPDGQTRGARVPDAVPSAAGRGLRVVWILLPVAAAAALLMALLATSDSSPERAADSHLLGEAAPLIEGATASGEWFDLDDLRGRWVVVNFFSTTCVPCIVEHPELVAFAEAHAASGDAAVVSIAFDDSAANVSAFFEANGGDWPVLVADTGRTAVRYGVTGVPESYLVAPNGAVAAKIVGGVTAAELDRLIAPA